MLTVIIAAHPAIAEIVASLFIAVAFALPVIAVTRFFAIIHERLRDASEYSPASAS
jgi:hypothetical protein